MKLAIGNDHAAVEMKNEIVKYLEGKGYEIINVGTDTNESCNYAEYGEKVANLVASKEADYGVLICGTGVGISLAANKVTARLSKQHNNSNVLAFGARIIGIETAKAIVDGWLETEYEGGRHDMRVSYLTEIEKKQKYVEK